MLDGCYLMFAQNDRKVRKGLCITYGKWKISLHNRVISYVRHTGSSSQYEHE